MWILFLLLTVPSPASLLAKYDAAMGASNFEGVFEMTAHREDNSTRTYKMRLLKFGEDKTRLWFEDPASVRGQEILRQGDNLWVYLPNLKRAVRMASRDSFQGGDFNNADVLRVNYVADYSVVFAPEPGEAWVLDLQAKNPDAAYDKIRLWIDKKSELPLRGEYYTQSGKLLRTAEFSEVRTFGDIVRPAKILMKNMLAQQRFSTLVVHSYNTHVTPKTTQFILDNLGR